MKSCTFIAVALAMAACQKQNTAPTPPAIENRATARFLALGHYEPGRLWREIARTASPADPALARPEDDEKVIAVVDSRTGEVRQCGNLSGACISFNPWMTSAQALQQGPVRLRKHLAEAYVDDEAEVQVKVDWERGRPNQ